MNIGIPSADSAASKITLLFLTFIEASFAKLMWILGNKGADYEVVRKYFYNTINYDINNTKEILL